MSSLLCTPIQHPQRPKSCRCTWAFRPVTFPSLCSAQSQPAGLLFKADPLPSCPFLTLTHPAHSPLWHPHVPLQTLNLLDWPESTPYSRSLPVFVSSATWSLFCFCFNLMSCVKTVCTILREKKHWAPNCCKPSLDAPSLVAEGASGEVTWRWWGDSGGQAGAALGVMGWWDCSKSQTYSSSTHTDGALWQWDPSLFTV